MATQKPTPKRARYLVYSPWQSGRVGGERRGQLKIRLALAGLFLCVLIRCGGSGKVTFNGTIRGQSFVPSDAISMNGTNGTSTFSSINITSQSGLCGLLSARQFPKNSKHFLIDLADVNQTPFAFTFTAPSAAGTYTVSRDSNPLPAKWASVAHLLSGADCQSSEIAFGVSGTVTITSLNGGSYSGNFDVTLNTTDHVTGSFNASYCDPPPTTTIQCI